MPDNQWLARKENMLPFHVIKAMSKPRSDLIGQYYNCVFDEAVGEYNASKPHKHRIVEAYKYCDPSSIQHGLTLKFDDVGCKYGCLEKYISLI